VQEKDVQIAKVTREEKRGDLTAAVLDLLVTAGPTRKKEISVPRAIAFAYNVLMGANRRRRALDNRERTDLSSADRRVNSSSFRAKGSGIPRSLPTDFC
jgi:hypothetical protein